MAFWEEQFNAFWEASLNDPVGIAVPIFLLLIGLEVLLAARRGLQVYNRAEAWASIGMGVGVIFVGLAMKVLAFLAFAALYRFVAPDALKAFLSPAQWWSWVILLFADDFAFYWHHRLSHSHRVLWSAHENHHSAQTYNFAIALRQSWAEQLYKYVFWLPLAVLGFHPVMILTMISISLIYQFWLHTELVGKLGPLEWFLNTPSHHRVHHATNIKYLDRNHAGIFILWDRLFGTFVAEDTEKPIYGTRKGAYYTNPFRIATHEYRDLWQDVRRARSLREAWNYCWKAPGWQPGDTSQTTRALQQALKKSGTRP